VFERSEYPEGFPIERKVSIEAPSQTVVVDVTLPAPDDVSDVCDYSFVKKTREAKPVTMKAKDHDELYDGAVKQAILRTAHEVFESIYTSHVASVVVNGWVTYTDKATGNDKTSCVISVGTGRDAFTQINLARVDPSVCIKNLKGLIAGPLSQVAPVQPVLQLNREDRRFIESEAVLADLNSSTNLATIDWEAFEHLVRELFAQMFSSHGAEVKVTQASRDGGVDAVAFDPDPIRGGKFVIQAKRYTNVVPVSAVRDLYGTLVNEGASRGILVTTAYYGKDARAFAQDKPLTLIDGPNLVYLLEEHGHKVRIDIEQAPERAQVTWQHWSVRIGSREEPHRRGTEW
jgi:restriction system protein